MALQPLACLLSGISEYFEKRSDTTCIIINSGVWRHGRGPIRGGWRNMDAFWSKPQLIVVIKTTPFTVNKDEYKRWLVLVKYCDLLDRIRAKWLRIDLSFQSVRSYEGIRGASDSKGGRCPQSPVSTTVNGDCSTSHRRWRPVHKVGWLRSRRWWHRDSSTTVEVVLRLKDFWE